MPDGTTRRVRRLREGMIVRLAEGIDLSHYVASSVALDINSAYQVHWSQFDSGVCNHRDAINQDTGALNPNHIHGTRLMLDGIGDIFCDTMFERVRVPACEHICAPNCVCLGRALAAQNLWMFYPPPRTHMGGRRPRY